MHSTSGDDCAISSQNWKHCIKIKRSTCQTLDLFFVFLPHSLKEGKDAAKIHLLHKDRRKDVMLMLIVNAIFAGWNTWYRGIHFVREFPRAASNQAENVYETYIFFFGSRNFADMKHKKCQRCWKLKQLNYTFCSGIRIMPILLTILTQILLTRTWSFSICYSKW